MADNIHRWLGDLFRHYHTEVVRYAARLVGDRENGEEVVQSAYVRLARRSAEGIVVEHPRAYLFTAARNAAVDFTARRAVEWTYRVDVEDLSPLAVTVDPTVAFEYRQRLARLAVLLNELPTSCRTAFVMNRMEGRTHKEVAQALGISISMVEKHVTRALIHCRDLMRDAEES
ncbi:sigma-70 family RNA polymerase sigma factor [Hyphomicrobium sp. D-2]|uniref:sigma-70 family RNA polymerase sigma factor n=1 Tax=Hyphomicrobium sp. D-2 TaxID=3041621 RepID=UPI002456E518|nr:sigma-70 family RNA polymerase sigma factor [Hyphomicrobium sp. D-2]MDH4982026.1 sigma-70 family RNA polymerase sigma factor [Hyphomicrobium sp. D-2]